MKRKCLCLVNILVWTVFVLGITNSALAAEFYKGKSIRLIVGSGRGGGFDDYTRAIASHLANHIPGNPSVVVENMPGAGGLTAAHYLYDKVEPDGLTVGIWNSSIILSQALGDKSVKFDARKVGWIGAPSISSPTCAVMGFTGLKTWDDVVNSQKPVKMAGVRAGAPPDALPEILNVTVGTKFEVVSGFKNTTAFRVAMQKRQVDGVCFGWESMRTTARAMLDASGNDRLIPIVTRSNSQDPELKQIPQLADVVRAKGGEKGTAILKAWLNTFEFYRQFSLPPGTPRDRLLTLRKAFKATLEDPKFLADAKKSKLSIDYVSGEEIEKLVAEILEISPETKNALQFLLPEKQRVM